LAGGLAHLAEQTLAAGCDIVLQCSGQIADMVNVAKGLKPLDGESLLRAQQAEAMVDIFDPFNAASALEEFTELMPQLEPTS